MVFTYRRKASGSRPHSSRPKTWTRLHTEITVIMFNAGGALSGLRIPRITLLLEEMARMIPGDAFPLEGELFVIKPSGI